MPGDDPDPRPLPETLDGALDHAWRLLERAVGDRRHGFRLPVVATVDEAGAPDARTVVLRRARREAWEIACHSDDRSPKVAHLRERPMMAWTFYDRSDRVQVRAQGKTVVERPASSGRAQAAWERTALGARRCYLAPQPPSTPADGPSPNLPDHAIDNRLTVEQTRPGRARFCLITTTIESLEWLALRHDGHRRALFRSGETGPRATWLHP